ncbi:12747_t:CDS:1, partial [Gigaspora rosea]
MCNYCSKEGHIQEECALKETPEGWFVNSVQEEKEEKEERGLNLGEMSEDQKDQMKEVLSRYRDLFAREPSQLGQTTV